MIRRAIFIIFAIGVTAGAAQANQAGQVCLRSDQFKQITMSGDSAATVTDKDGKSFRVAFTAPCGARHIGVFFTTQSENMQTCLKAGSPLQTNKSGACTVKSVEAIPAGPTP